MEYDFKIPLLLGYEKGDKSKPVWIDIVKEIENLYIINKEFQKVHLILNPPQKKLLRSIAEDWNNKKPIRYIILKARQMGFSTVIEAFLFVVTSYQNYQQALIIADTAENATSLFNMSKRYYDTKKAGILPLTKKNNGRIIEYEGTESAIRVVCQGDNAGRGKTAAWLHASEFAFWNDPEETLTAIFQTIPMTNPKTGIFIESTANGFNSFKNRCDKAIAGDSAFKFMFFAWWEMPDYKETYDGFELTPKEESLKEKYNLSLEQITWWRRKLLEFDGDIDKMNQEYPSCPEDAFIATGSSVFNNELVSQRKEFTRENKEIKRGFFKYQAEYSRDGQKINVQNIRWVDDKSGPIKIYQEPLKGFPYVIGADPANGGADSFSMVALNNVNKHQVAVFNQPKVDPDLFGFQLYCLGVYYNLALLGPEVNTTLTPLKILLKAKYPNIYVRQEEDKTTHGYVNAYGVKTTIITKPIMIDEFREVFREDPTMIADYITACEMETFVVQDNKTTSAIKGKHDDNVMATAIALYISEQQTTKLNFNQNNTENVMDWINRTLGESTRKGGLSFNGYKS